MLKKIAILTTVAALSVGNVYAGMDEANKWIDEEFQPSALSKSDQQKEMEWFIKAAEPFKGMEINVLSETIPTHEYESKTLTKAFEEITGIKVNHQFSVKARWCRRCRPRCRPSAISMMPISTTRT